MSPARKASFRRPHLLSEQDLALARQGPVHEVLLIFQLPREVLAFFAPATLLVALLHPRFWLRELFRTSYSSMSQVLGLQSVRSSLPK